jgi:alcohol dehydrogenase
MSSTARVMVFHGPGRPLELREIPLPDLRAGEVLVRVSCCTLCGSDLHTYRGRRPAPLPLILGHEMLGEVVDLGPGAPGCSDGRPLRRGDRVTWSVAASCRACFYCTHDLPQKCERLLKYGHEIIREGWALSGGLADHCHLKPGTAIVRVPAHIPDAVACPASCATATVAAILRQAGPLAGQRLLIQGAGLLGLTACAMASVQGAAEILIADLSAARLELAHRFGATGTAIATASETELADLVYKQTACRGADVAIDLSGANAAVEAALRLLRIGGRLILAGSVFPAPPLALSAEEVVRRWLTIQGVHNYAPRDLAAAVMFLSEHGGRFPFAEVVQVPAFSLAETEAAFTAAETCGLPRVAVLP